MKKALRTKFGSILKKGAKTTASLDKESTLSEIVKMVADQVLATFDPLWMELVICCIELNKELSATDMVSLSAKLGGMQLFQTYKAKLKSLAQCFGKSDANLLTFLPHRAIYFIGAVQAAVDELQSLLPAHSGSTTSTSDVEVLAEATQILSHAVALLRQMLAETSSLDIEFAEASAPSATEDGKTEYVQRWVLWHLFK